MYRVYFAFRKRFPLHYIRGFASMSFQSVPCISTGTTLNNRQVYKAFTSFIIPQPNVQLINIAEFNIPVLVLVVFTHDKEILKWLSICPKYSRKLPKSFFYDRKKFENKNVAPKWQTTSSPPFFLRDSRASKTRARVKINPREKRINGGLLVVYKMGKMFSFLFE